MTLSGYFFPQGQENSQITKSRETNALHTNLFKTPISKSYVSLVSIAATQRRRKICSLTIQLHHVKISAKSNKTRIIIFLSTR